MKTGVNIPILNNNRSVALETLTKLHFTGQILIGKASPYRRSNKTRRTGILSAQHKSMAVIPRVKLCFSSPTHFSPNQMAYNSFKFPRLGSSLNPYFPMQTSGSLVHEKNSWTPKHIVGNNLKLKVWYQSVLVFRAKKQIQGRNRIK